MNLTDSTTAARLDAMGIPSDVAVFMSRLGVSVGMVERLHATGVSWLFVQSITHTHAFKSVEDVAALVTFLNFEVEVEEITAWVRLGSLDAALRLHLLNVAPSTVQAFPLDPTNGLPSFLRMIQSIAGSGIHVDDVLLWHTAGVLTLTPPYLIEAIWAPWRSAGVHHLGMRTAALAAAAGLSVSEAVTQWAAGEIDAETLKMMAALRTGTF